MGRVFLEGWRGRGLRFERGGKGVGGGVMGFREGKGRRWWKGERVKDRMKMVRK